MTQSNRVHRSRSFEAAGKLTSSGEESQREADAVRLLFEKYYDEPDSDGDVEEQTLEDEDKNFGQSRNSKPLNDMNSAREVERVLPEVIKRRPRRADGSRPRASQGIRPRRESDQANDAWFAGPNCWSDWENGKKPEKQDEAKQPNS